MTPPKPKQRKMPNQTYIAGDSVPLIALNNTTHVESESPPATSQNLQPINTHHSFFFHSRKRWMLFSIVSIVVIAIIIVLVSMLNHKNTIQHQPTVTKSPNTTFTALFDKSRVPDYDRVWNTYIPPLMVTRVPDTPTHIKCRDFLVKTLEDLGWSVKLDSFTAETPFGKKAMHNIIATRHAQAPNRLILAAHYDSKYFAKGEFIGAIDSAAPCAILLEVATVLKPLLDALTRPETSLQIVFFDGEEAWKDWTKTDSLYGSRHLAQRWSSEKVDGEKSVLDSISLLVLLDLLGAHLSPVYNFSYNHKLEFQALINAEQQVRALDMFIAQSDPKHKDAYFSTSDQYKHYGVDDDHKPFLDRKVPVLHLIPVPFPQVWHELTDNYSALNKETVINLSRVMVSFCVDKLQLQF